MKKLTSIFLLALLCYGCKKDPLPPEKVTLLTPAKNEACLFTGNVNPQGEALVKFAWNAAVHADKYELVVKNLISGTEVTRLAATNEYSMLLPVNTPYSWYVISKSSETPLTEQSETWKFYHSGPGIISYAPFPADPVSPTIGQRLNVGSGKITLDWSAADVDNDIVGFDVYFGTSATPTLLRGNVVESILPDVAVTSGTTCYWRIVSKDAKGNSADSGLLQFFVD